MERNEKAVKRYPSDDKKVVTLSVDPSVYAHMKELCRLSNLRPAQYFSALIEA